MGQHTPVQRRAGSYSKQQAEPPTSTAQAAPTGAVPPPHPLPLTMPWTSPGGPIAPPAKDIKSILIRAEAEPQSTQLRHSAYAEGN